MEGGWRVAVFGGGVRRQEETVLGAGGVRGDGWSGCEQKIRLVCWWADMWVEECVCALVGGYGGGGSVCVHWWAGMGVEECVCGAASQPNRTRFYTTPPLCGSLTSTN